MFDFPGFFRESKHQTADCTLWLQQTSNQPNSLNSYLLHHEIFFEKFHYHNIPKIISSPSIFIGKSLAKGYDRAPAPRGPAPPPPGPGPIPFAPEVFEPKPYSYAYEVIDPLGDTNFGHRESSDGNVVEGEYRVILPDGRTQIVT